MIQARAGGVVRLGYFDGITLREAIQAANTNQSVDGSTAGQPGNDLIQFAPNLSGTISLFTNGVLSITEPVFIQGNGAEQTVIDAAVRSRVFEIASTAGDVTIVDVTISRGRTTDADEHGGGIRSRSTGTLTIQNSALTDNTTTGTDAFGGAIFASGPVEVFNSAIQNNRATGGGGGIWANGAMKFDGSVISDNDAGFPGGGIGTSIGQVTVINSTVNGNDSLNEGGGVFAPAVEVINSTISNNTGLKGGGIYAGFAALTSSTISGNLAEEGGGIFGFDPVGFVLVNGSTIFDNLAATGGGISGAFGLVSLINSIVAGNHDTDASNPDLGPLPLVDARFSLIGDPSGPGSIANTLGAPNVIGTHNNPLDPRLGPLVDNGGPTKTHALLPDSPAIDAAGTEGELIIPQSVTSLTDATDFWKAGRLIDNSGFDTTVHFFNYAPLLQNQEQDTAWVTDAFLPHYFAENGPAAPELTFHFEELLNLSSIVVWGYNPFGVNNNEAKILEVSFSTDGGTTYGPPLALLHARTAAAQETLSFGSVQLANAVKIRISDNYDGEPGAGGGDRVGLGEIRFLGTQSSDQRGFPFARIVDGPDENLIAAPDMGAYELHPSELVVTTSDDELDAVYDPFGLSLREALELANAMPGADTITFAPEINAQPILLTRGQLEISDSVTIAGNGAANTIIDAQRDSRVFDITSAAGDVTFDGVTITGGQTPSTANEDGGGIRSRATGTLLVQNSTLTGNQTSSSSSQGGAIYAENNLVVGRSTISSNFAVGPGGGIRARGSALIADSTINNNQAGADGGGIFAGGFPVTVINSTITGNEAANDGGGLYGFLVKVVSSTIADNKAGGNGDGDGGGIFAADVVEIHNSIVAGNEFFVGGRGPDYFVMSPISEVRSSLIGDNDGTDLAPAPVGSPDDNGNLVGGNTAATRIDPRLGPLLHNGGPTQTRRPLAGSPVIDAGNDDLALDPISQQALLADQRGLARIVGDKVDMGAVELGPVPFALVVTTAEDELDAVVDPGDLSLREAIGLANGALGADAILFAGDLAGLPILLTMGQMKISDSLTIQGRGATQTVIDGQNNSRLFDITESTGDVTFVGLTLTGGRTIGTTEPGGAIQSNTEGELTIRDSVISGNSTEGALSGGGGIYTDGAVKVIGTTISDNSTNASGSFGGGIRAGGPVTVTSSTISGNFTTRTFGRGGGIHTQSSATVTNSTLSHNFTFGDGSNGGGISAVGAITLTNSTISDNSVVGDNADGGGLFSYLGPVTIRNSIVAGNNDLATAVIPICFNRMERPSSSIA